MLIYLAHKAFSVQLLASNQSGAASTVRIDDDIVLFAVSLQEPRYELDRFLCRMISLFIKFFAQSE